MKCWPLLRRAVLALVLLGAVQAAGELVAAPTGAPATEPTCGTDGATCPMTGDVDPISVALGPTPWTTQQVTSPSAPSFGALVYDPDFKQLERRARALLEHGLEVREALSPYKGSVDFETYVKQMDYGSGWDPDMSVDYTGSLSDDFASSCNVGGTGPPTLQDVVECADQHFRDARDIYAYLLVYAPGHRFRGDLYYVTVTQPGYTETLCGLSDKEDPDPEDPGHSGQVLDPIVDWCNFRARLRQAVRESANLRLIFGQQFMVDALGVHFSGVDLLGGENAVRAELAQLRAARYQFETAEAGLTEALGRAVGSGCFVSDFYTQSEWSLLSRAIGLRETAQHHIAVRRSYLDIGSPEEVEEVHGEALGVYRDALMNGYVKLIGMASLGAVQPPGAGCDVGERPDGKLAAEMAINMSDTRRAALEMSAGRNIFGFETSLTPAWPYADTDTYDGLKTIAEGALDTARLLEAQETDSTRAYDDSQADLRAEIQRLWTTFDTQIVEVSGCSRAGSESDEAWFARAAQQRANLIGCLDQVAGCIPPNPTPAPPALNPCPVDAFNACVNATGTGKLEDGSAKAALLELRGAYASYQTINKQVADIADRVTASNYANAQVISWLREAGDWEEAARVADASYAFTQCIDFGDWDEITTVVSTAACAVTSGVNIALQERAGAYTTDANIHVQDEENTKELKNLLLDQSELMIDAYAALQQFDSKKTEVLDQLDGLEADIYEAQRQRVHFLNLPANDPSHRIVRDSNRMQWARAMTAAGRLSYLAARRWEFEQAARLSSSNFRISDVYRARIANDVDLFLDGLDQLTLTQPGSVTATSNRISVARNVLQWTDLVLQQDGVDPEDYASERAARFRQWVSENTKTGQDGKPLLNATFATTLVSGGLWSRMIAQGYDETWLLKLNDKVSINLLTEQDESALDFRTVVLTERGQVHLKARSGCLFDYMLMAPAVMLGLEWPADQEPDIATGLFRANVNGLHQYTEDGFRTAAFDGRPASAAEFELTVYAGAPVDGMPDMDLQMLTDIELLFGTEHASRYCDPVQGCSAPTGSWCTRIDW